MNTVVIVRNLFPHNNKKTYCNFMHSPMHTCNEQISRDLFILLSQITSFLTANKTAFPKQNNFSFSPINKAKQNSFSFFHTDKVLHLMFLPNIILVQVCFLLSHIFASVNNSCIFQCNSNVRIYGLVMLKASVAARSSKLRSHEPVQYLDK